MGTKVKFPIRIKLLLLMVSLVLVSIVAYLALAIQLFQNDKTTLTYELNAGIVRTFAAEFKSEVLRLSDKAKLLTQGHRDPEWVRVVLETEDEIVSYTLYRFKPATQQWMEEASFFRPDYLKLYNLGRESLLQVRVQHPIQFEKVIQQGTWIGNSTLPEVAPLFTVAIAIKTAQEPAVAVVDVRLDRILERLRKSGIATVYVINNEGKLVAHPDASTLVRDLSLMDLPVVQDAVQSKLPLEMKRYTYQNNDWLSAYADVGIGGLKVISQVKQEHVLRAASRLINKSLLFAVLVITLSLFLSIQLARHLTLPLNELLHATEKMSRSEFGETVSVKTNDEIGQLADSFNHMSGELESQRIQIEKHQNQLIQSERLAAIGQVSRGVGHEFGNILHRVMGKIDLALVETENPKTKEHLEIALQAVNRAGVIVRNLQSFSKEQKKLEVASMESPINDALNLVNHELIKGSITLEKNFKPTRHVKIDSRALGQAFLNLFINATHAMPEGGKLIISTEEDAQGRVVCRVRDTGMGIPPEVLPRIFEYAFSTKGESGSGLGLSITKKTIEDCGGTISVKSEPGKGTEFIISIPVMGSSSVGENA